MHVTRVTFRLLAIASIALPLSPGAWAGDGLFGIDHAVRYDRGAAWSVGKQNIVYYGSIAAVGAGALWLGKDDALGDTLWRSVDAMMVGGAGSQALKWTFRRERPSHTGNPDRWFEGWGANSFPSGAVAIVTAAATPVMIRYGDDHPAVYALALLPVYEAVARVKTRRHW